MFSNQIAATSQPFFSCPSARPWPSLSFFFSCLSVASQLVLTYSHLPDCLLLRCYGLSLLRYVPRRSIPNENIWFRLFGNFFPRHPSGLIRQIENYSLALFVSSPRILFQDDDSVPQLRRFAWLNAMVCENGGVEDTKR